MLDKKLDFSTGGWLIGGRPTGLLISGDHLFLNYFFLGNGGWLIGRGLLILTWHYQQTWGCKDQDEDFNPENI